MPGCTCQAPPRIRRTPEARPSAQACGRALKGTRPSRASRGTGDRVLTNADIVDKYRSLTRSVISTDRQSTIEKTVLDIESLDDISKLMALLTPTVWPALE